MIDVVHSLGDLFDYCKVAVDMELVAKTNEYVRVNTFIVCVCEVNAVVRVHVQ